MGSLAPSYRLKCGNFSSPSSGDRFFAGGGINCPSRNYSRENNGTKPRQPHIVPCSFRPAGVEEAALGELSRFAVARMQRRRKGQAWFESRTDFFSAMWNFYEDSQFPIQPDLIFPVNFRRRT